MVITTLPPIMLQPFEKKKTSIFQALKQIAGRTKVLGGIDIQIPVEAKLAAASLLIPGVRQVAGRVALRAGKKLATPKGLILGTTAAGALTTSPKLRKAVLEVVSPVKIFERGRGVGKIVEDPSKLIPKEKTARGIKEKVIGILKEAGPGAAAGAALAGGALVVAKKAREKVTGIIPSGKLPAAILPAPPSITPTTQPLGAVKQPVEAVPVAVEPQPPVNITNTFNPSIKISFKKSRKFINQQLLIRS